MVLDAEPLQRLLVKINHNSDSTHWAEGMMTLDSGASISVISRKFASLSNIRVEKIQHSLQLVNASGEAMQVDGVCKSTDHSDKRPSTQVGSSDS